ncbi:MAG: hypothetical protein AMXMBFR47_13360 [Planctomycetota bacterium]
MGTFGAGIFDDDLALDVREIFREFIAEGDPPEVATRKVKAEFEDSIGDPDEEPTFWLALAATQSGCGRLMTTVRDRAVKLIDRGGDLHRWEDEGVDPKDRAARQRALARLRTKLLGPQRKPMKLRLAQKQTTEWKIGDAVSYRLNSGRLAILRVIGLYGDRGGVMPHIEVCDWTGREIPTAAQIGRMKTRSAPRTGVLKKFPADNSTILFPSRDLPADRVAVVAQRVCKKKRELFPAGMVLWKDLDEHLSAMKLK